ncbi:MAG TPA: ABC transporter permease [Gaiellaceae bacterium]|nr:ABC transporter permease [Gaiellaceae bacterium]
MGSFVIGRVASHVLLFFAVTLLVFVAFFVMPQNDSRFARRAPTAYRLHGGMIGEYAHYVWQFVRHGDLGRSYGTREKVTTRLIRATPVTLSLVAGGLIVWLLIAVPLGMLAALRPRSLLDRGASFAVIVGLSIHPVLLGLVLSYLFGVRLKVLPADGYCSVNNLSTGCDGLARWAEHLVLPWITFGVVNAALFTMMIRALVVEELNEEYVRTALAKGAGKARVLRAHLLRNVTLPLVTMIGVQAATSLGGVVFIETVFDLPGLGGMLRRGAQQRDLPLTAGSVLFLALAIMALNLIVDIVYGWLDPRIRAAVRET